MIDVLHSRRYGCPSRTARALLRGRGIALVETGGKPCCVDPSIDVSIAHAGDIVLVAISRESRIGIDIEPIDTERDHVAIAEEAISPMYADKLRALARDERARAFTTYWVRLEAAMKAIGTGLASFPLDPIPPHVTVRDVPIDPGYRAAIAWSTARC